ncbi:MAG TPA: hypothetical protein EYP41_18805 [Anaerolineae bacterium]|nr:hypothetical protein [Anaerolineae bacterium]
MLLFEKTMAEQGNGTSGNDGRVQYDAEQAIVQDFIEATAVAGVRADQLSLLNFYAALKSRPFLLLAAPAQTGKVALVHSLAQVIASGAAGQYHTMVGHARWASGSQNVSEFVEAQARFNTSKLLTLIEEAVRPENRNRLYIVCLTNISPAELHTLFSVPGWQMWPDMEPIPYPPNLRLIGTMDTDRFHWWDSDLLSHTIVVPWAGEKMRLSGVSPKQPDTQRARPFLHSCVRTEQTAFARLRRNLHGQRQAFAPLVQVMDILHKEDIHLPQMVMNQAIVFLANAWTVEDQGLFASASEENLDIALDLALAQVVLPWLAADGRIDPARHRLTRLLAERFQQAATFLQTL